MSQAKELSPKEQQNEAKKHFDHWRQETIISQMNFAFNFDNEFYWKAAFELHQAAESLFTMVLLVFTDYRPKLHDLEELESLVDSKFTGVGAIFLKSTEEQKRVFELL